MMLYNELNNGTYVQLRIFTRNIQYKIRESTCISTM